jgi:hypothetical protein
MIYSGCGIFFIFCEKYRLDQLKIEGQETNCSTIKTGISCRISIP